AAGGERQRGGDGRAQDSAARDPRCSGHGFASLQEYLTTGEPVSTRREACQGIRTCSAGWMRAKSRMPITGMLTSAPKRVAVSMFPFARRITYPRPSLPPTNSPTTAPVTARVAATFIPERSWGSDAGNWIFRKVLSLLVPMVL